MTLTDRPYGGLLHASEQSSPYDCLSRIILIMLLWAHCFPLIAIGTQAAPHLTFAAMRAMVAGSVLFVLALLAGHKIPRSRCQ